MRRWVWVGFWVYLGMLVYLTQRASGGPEPVLRVNLVPLVGIRQSLRTGLVLTVVNILGNITVFMPVGAALALLKPRWSFWRSVGLVLLFSASLEAGQYLGGLRVADIDDVLLNSAGAALGWLIARLLRPSMQYNTADEDSLLLL